VQTLTHTQAAVLVLLVHRPMSGYELLKDMDASFRYFWAPARSQVYAVLPRLVAQGLATAREVEQKARPDKVVYTITRAGRAALDAWLDEPIDHGDRNLFLLKLFAAEHLHADVEPLIRERKEWAESLLAELKPLEREITHGHLTLRHGIDHLRATVRWAEAALKALSVVVFVLLCVSETQGARAAAPPRPSVYCLRAAERPSAFWFKAGDGTKLAGVVFGKGTRGLVLAYQSDGTICQSLPHARRYAAARYRVLVFDFRAHGASSAGCGERYDSDVAGAVRELRKRGAKKLVLMGASLGGLAVLVAAPHANVDGVVSLSSPGAYVGLDAKAAVPNLRAPVLFVAANEDQNGPFDFAADARALHDAAGSTEKELFLTPGNAHGWATLARPAVRSKVDAFIRAHTQ
jgi:DNA-binding PadR family transcriptional regulator/pimeloyl-ACP methyl ester carboxylesterase